MAMLYVCVLPAEEERRGGWAGAEGGEGRRRDGVWACLAVLVLVPLHE